MATVNRLFYLLKIDLAKVSIKNNLPKAGLRVFANAFTGALSIARLVAANPVSGVGDCRPMLPRGYENGSPHGAAVR